MDNILEWRNQTRKRLIAEREAIPEVIHQQWSMAISTALIQGFPCLKSMKIGLYWPLRGEYDPRLVAQQFRQQDATLALPEVIDKHAPLCFREWWPDAPMKNGAYGIPIPVDTRNVTVDAFIIPMVGFDQQGYRLGYGSGFFDRTLATYQTRPLTIGVAFELQRLENIHPQSHDIAMQYIVTEAGIFQIDQDGLTAISTHQCATGNA